ncbi:MAG: ribosome silencing factor [Kiritimatiellae bacterium]|nr:ribosome silencing factor [Kiritimatiellia bacterium]
MEPDYGALARLVRSAAEEKKGQEPVILDVRTLSSVTDFFVIVTARSTPHLRALRDEVERAMKATGGVRAWRVSGTPESGWIVQDYLGVVVHLMTEEKRRYYALELLWNDAPRLD